MIMILLVLFLANIGVTFIDVKRLVQESSKISDVYVVIQEDYAEIVRHLEKSEKYINIICLLEDDEMLTGLSAEVELEISAAQDCLSHIEQFVKQLTDTNLYRVYEDYDTYIQSVFSCMDQISQQLQNGNRNRANELLSAELMSLIVEGETIENEFNNGVKNGVAECVRQYNEVLAHCRFITIVMVALFGVAVILVAFFTEIIIVRPMRLASSSLKKIIQQIEDNRGDLSERIPVMTNDEIGQIVIGVNQFMEQLQSIVSVIQIEAGNMIKSVHFLRVKSFQ